MYYLYEEKYLACNILIINHIFISISTFWGDSDGLYSYILVEFLLGEIWKPKFVYADLGILSLSFSINRKKKGKVFMIFTIIAFYALIYRIIIIHCSKEIDFSTYPTWYNWFQVWQYDGIKKLHIILSLASL